MKQKYSLILIAIVIAIAIIAYFFIANYRGFNNLQAPSPVEARHRFAYKINIDSLDIQYGKVQNNQNLSAILNNRISASLIDRIAKTPGDVFDVRKMKPGHRFAWISSKDSVPKPLYFVYEINDLDFVVFDIRDSLRVYTDKKHFVEVIKTAGGTIKSSLWNTFEENRLDLNLGMKMADIYAWTIDFYGLQKGDNFKLIYEEIYVDSVPTGADRILAGIFHSGGKDYYAFYFADGKGGDYFDDQGKSLRRSFLKAPLKFSRISSRYSKARMHPVLRIVRPHFGVDYAAPRGTPVVSLGDGRIVEAGWKGGYGRFISVRHNSIYTSTYAHLSGYAKGIKAGTSVKQGEVIGFVGSSGLATGAHLDFRVYKGGSPVDPLKVESPPTDPVKPELMNAYKALVGKMKGRLDSLR
jgi:murein DD-endopeptidase MepM/ murein hydrolase activator NlpD